MRGRTLALAALATGCRIHFDPLGDDVSDAQATSDGTSSDGAQAACLANPSYTTLGSLPTSRYLVVTSSLLDWLAAEQACEQDGAHLIIVDSEPERAALVTAIPGAIRWVGLSERVNRGTFLTVTGAVPAFLPWGAGEPSGSVDDCVQVDSTTDLLDDNACTGLRRYVCECDGVRADPTSY